METRGDTKCWLNFGYALMEFTCLRRAYDLYRWDMKQKGRDVPWDEPDARRKFLSDARDLSLELWVRRYAMRMLDEAISA